MPLYEYRCESCDEVIEKLQSRGAPAPARCPACQEEGTLSRMISSTSFQLKGSGWYVTDYKNQGSGGASKADEPASSGESTESTESAESTGGNSSDQGSGASEAGASASSSSSDGGDSAA